MKPVFVITLGLLASSLLADERIERAMSFGQRIENRVFRDRVQAHWAPDGKSFWYRIQMGPQRHEFVRIDAETGERKTASELKSLDLPPNEPLKSSTTRIRIRRSRRTGVTSEVKFHNKLDADVALFWINPQGEQVPYGDVPPGGERAQHSYDGHVWLIARKSGEPLAVIEAGPVPQAIVIDGPGIRESRPERASLGDEGRSPDGRWFASVEDGRVLLRNLKSDEVTIMETDLDGVTPFRAGIVWAPDSSAFVVCNAADVSRRQVTLVESSPRNQTQPKLKEFEYAKPGDPLPNPLPVLFRLDDTGPSWKKPATDLFLQPFTESYRLDITWSADSREFYFDYNQRGHQLYRVLAVNSQTGEVRIVVEETSRTFVDYTRKTWRHWLPATGELLWMSERDGWCHLWLYDVATGKVKNQVTRGAWPVRQVLHVDETRREVWFMASGLRAGEDPYFLHLCRIGFDGDGFRQLTEGDGQHDVEFSPDRQSFIDTWSRVDQPPISELRRCEDGQLVCVLERADTTELIAAGWTVPERFVAKGRDGQTEIHGILIRPSHFDPAKKYPVVEEIYAGPHSAFVPKAFSQLVRQHAVAELGAIVVQIDGMGTNHRGKAFHDVCWKNLKDAGFPDRIAWLKAAAATRPWMDLARVGIYGGSAGGQNAMRALLDHGDFYKVAVADCGCHDNRMDKIWWNEQWLGWPVDESYEASSNVQDAHRLQGKLLLIVGELDTNVDPASTYQVVGALQKAGKPFEFMPLVGVGHGAAETPYGSRLRLEFLLRNLGL